MTALEFLAKFRHVEVHSLGHQDGIYWVVVEADIDGTETQGYFVMERAGELRTVLNLSAEEEVAAVKDPTAFWNHLRAQVLD